MPAYQTVLIVGTLEICIGMITLFHNVITVLFQTNIKSPGVLFFVIVTSCASTLLGIGLLIYRKWAHDLLIYFSSVIILSKILIFLGVITLNGALEVTVPGPVKNSLSILYHSFLVYFLIQPDVRTMFHGKAKKTSRNASKNVARNASR